MRILVVQEADWIKVGPHQSHHLMERLSVRGHEIRVIDFEFRWRDEEVRHLISKREVFPHYTKAVDKGDVTIIRPPIIKVPTLDYLSLVGSHTVEIARQIHEFRPDVIVGFGILNAAIAIRLARLHRIPFIYYIIDELHKLVPQPHFRRVARFIESQNMRRADRVISINEGLREYTIGMGARREHTEVIRAGVDIESFRIGERHAIRKKFGIRDEDIVLFFMGWLYDFSGLKEVAMELTHSPSSSIKLLILGRGDLWEMLQQIRDEYGLNDRLTIQEWVPYDQVPQYIMASDICILPAYKNDIMMNIVPIKLYEYMAAGKPVIATSLPGIQKEFGWDNGVIYVDRPEDVVPKVIELIQRGSAPENGKKARNFVEKLSWDRICDRFSSVLTELA